MGKGRGRRRKISEEEAGYLAAEREYLEEDLAVKHMRLGLANDFLASFKEEKGTRSKDYKTLKLYRDMLKEEVDDMERRVEEIDELLDDYYYDD
ncbi:MAG: hypothetical protein ACP6IP_04280 [Candidatus Njordarchaeia archaeon]